MGETNAMPDAMTDDQKMEEIRVAPLANDEPDSFSTGGGERHQRAGPAIQVSPPHPTTAATTSGGRFGNGVASKEGVATKIRPTLADLVGCDGSDLDISDSLPQDENSPVLSGGPRTIRSASPPAIQPKVQPVYAVVKKKKKPKSEDISPPPPRVATKPSRTSQPVMTDAPRSPGKIPLIRISKTESVEQADKMALERIDDPAPKQVRFKIPDSREILLKNFQLKFFF